MNNILLFFLMFCGGLAVAMQPSINSRLAQKIGFLESSCISFAVGTLALYLVALVAGRGSFRSLPEAAWWELSGGLLGAYFVSMTILAVPRIGTTAALAATIAAQLLTGLVLDTFGLFASAKSPSISNAPLAWGFSSLGPA
ncbi:DMT family transporter [Geotalea toluenoxydans]|uniref:DMT family transporter n=1 Tax=Geotalea toluenoxydans TaxID=421624 RepID=UPI000AF6B005|nr:DMT family transporter [Geotalea toluenoxydans]